MRQPGLRRPLTAARRIFRLSEAAVIGLAVVIGIAAALMTAAQGSMARMLQLLLYGDTVDRLSALNAIEPAHLVALPLGGAMLALVYYLLRRRKAAPVDVVEANALHGGAIPLRDSLIVSLQTLLSNGSGASVGLEAAYAQMGGGVASLAARFLRLRRSDVRTLVGAGAGAAIGAAFSAPLTGAFYAFEIVMGAYTPAALAPVAAAALAAAITMRKLHVLPYLIAFPGAPALQTGDYLLFAVLGLVCAIAGIALMRAVTVVEQWVRRSRVPDPIRPILGGLLLMPIAWLSPQALSAGHGALHLDLSIQVTLGFLAMVLLLKMTASVVSLGFGFRGGLFFASLFLGSLLGQLFAGAIHFVTGASTLDPNDSAIVGMAAMSAAVVGGPMTMSMMVLETTHDLALTGTALTAALCASTLVREIFGFSFSTWRLHTRGETIRSARDIGWIRSLTAGRLMRRVPVVSRTMSVEEFRRNFPLGSIGRVVLVDETGKYAGLVQTAAAYDPDLEGNSRIAALATMLDCVIRPEQNARAMMAAFDEHEADDLAVTDQNGEVLGLVSEKHVRRRYLDEVEKAQRALFGE